MSGNVTEFRRPQPLDIIAPPKWQGIIAPPYDWMVDGCFLRGTVAMLSGDGGLGKSLLIQQLCTAAATGKAWLGLATKQCKSLAVFCEDDEDELHRRQEKINAHYGIDHGDIEGAQYMSRVGQESMLAAFRDKGEKMEQTAFFDQVQTAAKDFGAQIVVFDTVADVFSGDEIRRTQVRRFVTLLRRLALSIQGVVILTAHPSLQGMSTGTGLSGSTAWNNSVRSRLYLTASKDADADQEARNERWLKTMKNNQGAYGDKIQLRWSDGVFVRTDTEGPNFLEKIDLDRRLLDALRDLVKSGTRVAADRSAKNSFAAKVRDLPQFKRLPFSAALASIDRLREAGKVVVVPCGQKSRPVACIRTTDSRYLDEIDPPSGAL